jgi:hypothetical protein
VCVRTTSIRHDEKRRDRWVKKLDVKLGGTAETVCRRCIEAGGARGSVGYVLLEPATRGQRLSTSRLSNSVEHDLARRH